MPNFPEKNDLNARLTTARLVLEPLAAHHADALFNLLQPESIYLWISASRPADLDRLRAQWKQKESRLSPTGKEAWLNWAVRRIDDGKYVGKCDAEIDCTNEATNVGYLFFPEFWGLGYATESVIALAEHFERSGVTKQRATVTNGNLASSRVLEKAGFRRNRILPNNDIIRGIKHDDIEYIRDSQFSGH